MPQPRGTLHGRWLRWMTTACKAAKEVHQQYLIYFIRFDRYYVLAYVCCCYSQLESFFWKIATSCSRVLPLCVFSSKSWILMCVLVGEWMKSDFVCPNAPVYIISIAVPNCKYHGRFAVCTVSYVIRSVFVLQRLDWYLCDGDDLLYPWIYCNYLNRWLVICL